MKTKLFTLIFALVVSVGTMFADKVKIGDLYYNLNAKNRTAEVTYEFYYTPNNYSGLIVADIPSSVVYESETYSVTSIGDEAFEYCISLTSVTIPNGVTTIGYGAFAACALTSITIPNSVTSLGDGAFCNCRSLKSIEIPNGITGSIGEDTFRWCTSLTSVTIGNGVTTLGKNAFYGCSSLTSVTIGNSVTSIMYCAFYGCSSLTTVTIPNSVTSIEDQAFAGCSSLTYITIGSGVTYIGGSAFDNDNSSITVTCYAVTPPESGKYVFGFGTDMTTWTLYVPAESVDAYKTTDPWKDFGSILPIGSHAAIEDVEAERKVLGSDKLLRDGQILILRGEKTYTLQGQEVR